jgi:hypothetical protein
MSQPPRRTRLCELGAVLAAAAVLAGPARASEAETPLEEALRRYPPTPTNAAALDVERLAAPLGIDLVPRGVHERDRPDIKSVAAFEATREPMTAWIKSELTRSSGPISKPPAQVGAFLTSRRGALSAARAGLLRGEAPVWAESLDPRHRPPRANFAQRYYLAQIFLADALEQGRAGRYAAAFEDLEALWKLGEDLPASPMTTPRFFFGGMVRSACGALRRLDHVPAVWRERLRTFTPVAMMLESLRLEVSLASTVFPTEMLSPQGPFAGIQAAVARVYWRKCLDEATAPQLERLDDIAAAIPLCDASFDESLPSVDFSWWNHVGQDFYRGQSQTLRGASRAALEAEMTLKILDLRAARDENHGRWPESLAGLEKSENCPKDHWIYEVDPQGRMRLSLSRALSWDNPVATILPTTYEEVSAPEKAGKPKAKTLAKPGPDR